MSLNARQIREVDDLPLERVDVPEWGGEVFVRTMSAAERDAWEIKTYSERGDDEQANLTDFRTRLAILCVVDETGKPIFTEEDFVWLRLKSSLVISRIYDVASRMNGLSKKDVDELTKK